MELAQQYIDSRSQQIKHIEEDLGECHEVLFNPHTINRLQVWARPYNTRVCIDGIWQIEGEDYRLIEDSKGSYIQFLHNDSRTIQYRNVEVYYQGYRAEGDGSHWN